MLTYLSFIVLGIFAGFLAGLLGIGGGLIIVPFLSFVFALQGSVAPEYVMHLALGTSLTSIIFTSISSTVAHHRRGAILWPVWLRIVPGILIGTFAGSRVAAYLPTNFLKVFFAFFLYYVAFRMIRSKKTQAGRDLPGRTGMLAAGSGIGFVASWVGIGGGTLSVPFLSWCSVELHKAIGTSAAIGLPIALAGAVGYATAGLGKAGLPPYSLGFVNLAALFFIVLGSVATAPLGARVAHSLPVPRLKKFFAVLLLVLGTRMWVSVFI